MAKQATRISLTAGRIEALECPLDKGQIFVWDTQAPALSVRVAKGGRKTFVFESRLDGKTIRITIGDIKSWAIGQARAEANRLKAMVDTGHDPREQKRQQQAEREAVKVKQEAEAVTVEQAWRVYIEARSSKWGKHHKHDHERLARAPGVSKAGKSTNEGPLYFFMSKRLAELTPELIEVWAESERQTRPTAARLSYRLLRAFLSWCARQPAYKTLLADNPATNSEAREMLGAPKAKKDVLLREQLPAFFEAAQNLTNPAIAAYIQALLITGARPSELLALKWDDMNGKARSLTIRDKDESKGGQDGTRTIPLTPYVHHLLAGLPRRTEWVFSSDTLNQPISPPHNRLADVARIAGIDEITFHGLRRSYASLSEWLELPAGVIAQIQGHKPSATREKHYIIRPLDLLRLHHERFEAWILEQAGIQHDTTQQAGALRVVADNT
ncbi:MAG TPA: integrase family protein [Thiopseudomonas sp.]|nr:integrase family protein [Thiopseudomonas sp.]